MDKRRHVIIGRWENVRPGELARQYGLPWPFLDDGPLFRVYVVPPPGMTMERFERGLVEAYLERR